MFRSAASRKLLSPSAPGVHHGGRRIHPRRCPPWGGHVRMNTLPPVSHIDFPYWVLPVHSLESGSDVPANRRRRFD